MHSSNYNSLLKNINRNDDIINSLILGRFIGAKSDVIEARDIVSEFIGDAKRLKSNLCKDSPQKQKYTDIIKRLEICRESTNRIL